MAVDWERLVTGDRRRRWPRVSGMRWRAGSSCRDLLNLFVAERPTRDHRREIWRHAERWMVAVYNERPNRSTKGTTKVLERIRNSPGMLWRARRGQTRSESTVIWRRTAARDEKERLIPDDGDFPCTIPPSWRSKASRRSFEDTQRVFGWPQSTARELGWS
jgi:hypothetical protein